MKKTVILAILVLFAMQNGLSQKKNFTYEEAYGRRRPMISNPLPRLMGWLDDAHYLEMKTEDRNQYVYKVDAKTGDEEMYLDYLTIEEKLPEGFTMRQRILSSDDMNHFLFRKAQTYLIRNLKKIAQSLCSFTKKTTRRK